MKLVLFWFACLSVVLGTPQVVQRGKELLKEILHPRPIQRGRELLKSVHKRSIGSARIVGGSATDIEQHPHQVCLLDDEFHFCGGSLISPTWVVTAAHCIDAFENSPSAVTVGAGANRYKDTIKKTAKAIYVHPDYDGFADGFPNDVGLIELSEPFETSDKIDIIEMLPEGDSNTFAGEDCTITGWGKTDYLNPGVSETLQGLDIPVITNAACSTTWVDVIGATINDGHICLFEQTGGESACSGDSGGPLTCKVDGKNVLAGATSWGISTCSGDYPSVYTRISTFRKWIKDTSGI